MALLRKLGLKFAWLSVAILLLGCGNKMIPVTTNIGNGDSTPEPPPASPMSPSPSPAPQPTPTATPTNWPKCWLSHRLATAEAFRLQGMQPDGTNAAPIYQGKESSYGKSQASAYRYEFAGKMVNPSTTGDCVLNWLVAGHTHAQEPWIDYLSNNKSFTNHNDISVNRIAAVSCTVASTPDCTCVASFADINDDTTRSVMGGQCVKDDNSFFSVNDPAGTNTIQLQDNDLSDCQAINKSALSVRDHASDYEATADKAAAHIVSSEAGFDVSCRLDIAPFAPDMREKDWYAHDITHWGALTCTKKDIDLSQPHCRCYIHKNKSYYKPNDRSRVVSFDTCLWCDGSSCKAVSNSLR